jgi:hypothetical protein
MDVMGFLRLQSAHQSRAIGDAGGNDGGMFGSARQMHTMRRRGKWLLRRLSLCHGGRAQRARGDREATMKPPRHTPIEFVPRRRRGGAARAASL